MNLTVFTALLFLIVLWSAEDVLGKRNKERHSRDSNSKGGKKGEKGGGEEEEKEAMCVMGYCLPQNYNRLELPTDKARVDIKMNLEVSILPTQRG